VALEIICGYGGWHALESILFVIANGDGIVLDKAKELLNKWLIKATNIYSNPDEATGKRIISLCDDVKLKSVIHDDALKELRFFIEARI